MTTVADDTVRAVFPEKNTNEIKREYLAMAGIALPLAIEGNAQKNSESSHEAQCAAETSGMR